jgi:hypothetical protein
MIVIGRRLGEFKPEIGIRLHHKLEKGGFDTSCLVSEKAILFMVRSCSVNVEKEKRARKYI